MTAQPTVKHKVVEVINDNTFTIDTNNWCIPKKLAEQFGVSLQVVNAWQKRGKLNVRHYPALGLTMVQIKPEVIL